MILQELFVVSVWETEENTAGKMSKLHRYVMYIHVSFYKLYIHWNRIPKKYCLNPKVQEKQQQECKK